MNLKIPLRLGRILVVLALIVALLGSSIPVPARAVGLGTVYEITARLGMEIASRAIGIGPGNSPDAFNNIVNRMVEAFEPVSNRLCQLLITGSSGNFRSFLSADFLSWVLSWLFDSGTIKFDDGFANSHYVSYPAFTGTFVADSPFFAGYYCFRGNYTVMFYSTAKQYAHGTSSSGSTTDFPIRSGPYNGYYCGSASNSWRDPTLFSGLTYFGDITGFVSSSASSIEQMIYILNNIASGVTSVSTSEDLTLDSVGNSLDAAPYTSWVGQSVSNDDQAFVPVSVPSLDSSAISAQTQTQAQAGTIPDAVVDEIIAGEDVVPDTGTIADVITSIRALGADIVAAIQAVPAAIADVFSPPAISDEYMISLSDFFPFCLPFDIYDLLSALAADPQAPVFEWTIAVPRWGISHDIEIDLSEWDDIARLFRTFELGAFVLGLALITRQKFLRS